VSSKRSRRERRQGQIARVFELRDLAGFRAAFDRAPELARSQLIQGLSAPPSDPAFAAELDALGVEIARRLRRAENPAAALAVAAAGRRRTEGLRMEEALAAFALGRDEISAAIADADPAVAAVLNPLLRATRGEVNEASQRRQGGSPLPPTLRALHAAARAVGWAVQAEPTKARAILDRIDRPFREQTLAKELGAAADISGPQPAAAALKTLLDAPVVHQHAELRETLLQEVATSDAVPALDALRRHAPEEPLVQRLVLQASMREAATPGTAAEIVRRIGTTAFPPAERATASIYEGFALLSHNPAQAARSFDRAIELGGDLTEALRGKLLAALKAMPLVPPGSNARQRASREAATSAERLARALARDPQGKPLAAAAEVLAARHFVGVDDAKAALAAVAKARSMGSGGLLAEIDLTEARATALARPAEARARVDALLAEAPSRVDLWRLQIEFARRQGDAEGAAQILLAAAEATKEPSLVAEARRVSAKRQKLGPFEGLVPGEASAGVLARELERIAFDEGDRGHGPIEQAAPYREALGPSGRLAFDAAAIAFALTAGDESEAEARLLEAVRTWRSAPGDLARIVAATIGVDVTLAGAAPAIVRALADDVPALRALTEVFIAAGMGAEAAKVLKRFASELPRSDLARLQSLVKLARQEVVALPGVPDPSQALREIDRALSPAFRLIGFLRESDQEEYSLDADDPRSFDDALPDDLDALFDKLLDVADGQLPQLPPVKLRALERKLQKLIAHGPSTSSMAELVELLDELNIPADALLKLGAPRRRKAPQPGRRMR
jgi:hypothetical protein